MTDSTSPRRSQRRSGSKGRSASGRSGRWAVRSKILSRVTRFVRHPAGKVLLGLGLLGVIAGGLTFNHFWWKYSKVVDAKLAGGPFNRAARILASPEPIFVGQQMTLDEVLLRLREAGYSDSKHNQLGYYRVKEDEIEVYPGPLSYFAQEPAVLYFDDDKVSRIVSLNDNTPQTAYELEPELVTHLFDDERSKRRLFKFEDYPQVLVDAVLAIEDHRFYSHWGVDPIRTTKAAIDGLVAWEQPRGTSTLTQQLSRNFFLTAEQTYERKLAEALIALQLEMRLSKDQIFEYYANQVSMGRSGSFNIMGMGEAARAYFDKDVRDLTLAEAALLAGLPQGPSWLNPYRHPDRATNRRNQVLRAMERHGYIDEASYQAAAQEEITLARGHIESSHAPYYVDLVNQHLQERFDSEELISQDYWIYTTLDQELQAAAVEAVRSGMAEVDKKIAKQRRWKDQEPPQAQAALVALDPHTGEVKAIVGGRDYGESQLNRVLAKRQPGSVFKPLVYAAALDTALDVERAEDPDWPADAPRYEPGAVFTPSSLIDDVPTTFWYDDKPYEPANFMNKIYGLISLREALKKSINIATVRLAEMVGYDRVYALARTVDLGGKEMQPTPSIALGSYEATPLQIAGAYTAFANHGVMKKPYFVRQVRDAHGRVLQRYEPEEVEALDPRVAYMVTNILEDVILHGTGAGARYTYHFEEPSAGKTGTDDDGWFAGYTENLLCVVWVGFDNNVDIGLEGAHSALPIWADFMKRAHEMRQYRNPSPFEAPEGVVKVELDPATGELATYACSERTTEVFIEGSEPTQFCRLHGRGGVLASSVAGWDHEEPVDGADPAAATAGPSPRRRGPSPTAEQRAARAAARAQLAGAAPQATPVAQPAVQQPALEEPPAAEPDKKKSGFLKKVLGVFK